MYRNKFIVGIFVLALLFVTNPVSAAVSNWTTAASISPRSNTDFASSAFQQSLRNLKATNANTVSLILPYYTSNCNSSNVIAGSDTPTDAALVSGINYAKSIGLRVNLKPHLEAFDNWGGYCLWRANIDPADRAT